MCYFLHPFQDMGSLGILNAKIVFNENVPIASDIKTLILRMLDVSNARSRSMLCCGLFIYVSLYYVVLIVLHCVLLIFYTSVKYTGKLYRTVLYCFTVFQRRNF